MDRPVIVIRDIHRYGDDLTVPEAIARLCGGGPVTVTVTADLASDLGLSPASDRVLAAAEDAYFTAAGEAFWAEAERIARDRAQYQLPATGQ